MFRKLAETSVENPVAVHLLSLLILVAGVHSYLTMPREIFPDFTRNRLLVSTPFIGASPEDIEELITVKVEDAVDTVDGVETVESTSMEGVSLVDVYLRRGTNVDRALTDLDRALDTITGLPEDAEEPTATEIKTQFPDGPMDSTAHVLQYEAVSSAVAAIRALLTSQPPDKQWRDVILRYALRAWSLTEGDPDKDETVRDALTRAVADYRPPTPEQLKRSTEPAAKGAAKSSPAGKKGGES